MDLGNVGRLPLMALHTQCIIHQNTILNFDVKVHGDEHAHANELNTILWKSHTHTDPYNECH